MSRRRLKRSSKSNKQLAFVPSSGIFGAPETTVWKDYNKVIRPGNRGPRRGWGLQMLEENAKSARKRDPKTGRYKSPGEIVIGMENAGTGTGSTTISGEVKIRMKKDSSVTVKASNVSPQQGKHYKNSVTFGSPRLSKGWHYLRAISGTTTDKELDTLRDWSIDGGNRSERNDFEVGFNQKGIWHDNAFGWNRSDVEGATDLVLDNATNDYSNWSKEESLLRPYGGFVQAKNTITLENTNTYFPAVMKVHVCCLEDSNVLMRSRMIDETTSTFDTPVTNDGPITFVTRILKNRTAPNSYIDDAIPRAYKLESGNEVLDSDIYTQLLIDPRANLNYSTFWRKNVQVVQTLKRTINPADTWDISMTQNFPRGIDLKQWQIQASETDVNRYNRCPLGYFFVLEIVGKKCEAVATPVSTAGGRAIGTSPVSVIFEATKTYTYINSSATDPTPTGVTRDANNDYPMAIRVFKTKGTTQSGSDKLFNFNYDKLTDNPETATGSYVIPITTDVSLAYAKNNAKADGN